MITQEIEKINEIVQDLPKNWKMVRLKNICSENLQYGINTPSSNYAECGIRFLRTTDIDDEGNISVEGIYLNEDEVSENNLLIKGDLLFSRSGTIGRCYLHDSNKKYCYAGFLVRFRTKDFLTAEWCYYFSFTPQFKQQVFSDAIETTILNFNGNKYANIKIPFPPLVEMDEIVRHIKAQSEKISKFIQKKQHFIDLLNEQRQSIISRIVLEGIPNKSNGKTTSRKAETKSSGLEWLGEIPYHWEMRRCKNVFYELDIRSENGNEELLSVSHYDGVRKRSEKNVFMFKAEDYTGYKLCWAGDLVINIMWAWMGALGISKEHGIVSSAYGVYRLKNHADYDSEFLDFLFRNPGYILEYTKRSKGVHSSRARMYSDEFFNILILTPPIEEQKQIVEHIKTETKTIDTAIAKAEREIELIKEYKEAMIAEAVMGKMKN